MNERKRKPTTRRCAVYTRKSTQEGLEQAFNTLDAQRGAGASYVRSQHQEGWRLLPERFDDGGYTGVVAVDATGSRTSLSSTVVA